MIKGLKSLSTFIAPKVNSDTDGVTSAFTKLRLHFQRQGICVACLSNEAADGLCPGCANDLPVNQHHCCQCALPMRSLQLKPGIKRLCGECLREQPPFRQIIAPLEYRFPVDAMILRYKYGHQRAFAKPLLNEMTRHLKNHLCAVPDDRPDLLLPCPMHPTRRRQKGINQASDIAEHLSRELNIPWSTNFLTRHRQTPPQQGLTRKQRLNNLKDAFAVAGTPPARVAIIDDVVTTGSTARTLCGSLLKAGAEDVQVWALARTPA